MKNWKPAEKLTAADEAFPASVMHLMPAYNEIPEEFRRWPSTNKWGKLVADWFFSGLKSLEVTPKPGIDPEKALRHIKAILRSYEPKHEHKEAACAYLFSLWFEDEKHEALQREL